MIYDIQKILFLTKKLVELKSVRLVQRANRSKFKKFSEDPRLSRRKASVDVEIS